MGTTSEPASDQPDERVKLKRAVGGDQGAWAQILAPHRNRLRRMVALRLDQRLRGRIDPSDVLQEAFLRAAQAGPKYLDRPEQPVFLWLRWLTGMTLQLPAPPASGGPGSGRRPGGATAGPALA